MLITRSEFYNFIATAYWSAFVVVLVILLFITFAICRKAQGRIIGSVISLLIACVVFVLPVEKEKVKIKKVIKEKRVSYRKAKALFDEKCKTAGEKIYRTVEDVEGVTLLKMPKPHKHSAVYDPMWEDAGLKRIDWYIYSLLGTTFPNYSHGLFLMKPKIKKPEKNQHPFVKNPTFGYGFVDVKEKTHYKRYILPWEGRWIDAERSAKVLLKEPSRYAITYEAPIIPDERKYWIAVATIKVIDTKDNSLIAEKTTYLFDHGLGSGSKRKSGRQPWFFAKNCPANKVLGNQLRYFVEKVLKPKQPNFDMEAGE